MYVSEESDHGILPLSHSNNDTDLSAESGEGRLRIEENPFSFDTVPRAILRIIHNSVTTAPLITA
jgi:hypothetical protein